MCRQCYDKARTNSRRSHEATERLQFTPPKPVLDVVDLIAAIIRSTVPLRGAACIGSSKIFDDIHGPNVAIAQEICSTCPVRRKCLAQAKANANWVTYGVIGSELFIGGKIPKRDRVPVPA